MKRYLFGMCRWCLKVVAFLLLSGACVEPYLPEIIVEDHRYLIVDGFLVNNDSTRIRLSRSQVLSGPNIFSKETDAAVSVESESGVAYGLTEKGDGLYVAPALGLNPELKYRLRIQTDDRYEYISDYVSILSSPPLDSVTWKEVEKHDVIEFSIFAHDPENKTEYYLWTYDETWKYASASTSVYYYEGGQMLPRDNATELYYCWKTNRNTNVYLHTVGALSEDVVYDFKLFSLPQSSRKLYFGYSILVKQYALNKEAFDYWTITKKNSESLGGLFDPLPTQALGNFHCVNNPEQPVLGYFSASTVQKKRVFFNRQQISGPGTRYSPSGYESCESDIIRLDEISDMNLAGKLINDRAYDPVTQELVGYVVFPKECVDCRFMEGTTTMPDYWR